jgi:hypothetical protein
MKTLQGRAATQGQTPMAAGLSELQDGDFAAVSGGVAKSYCVYSNGKVGVHDFESMTSRPLNSNELCSR